MPEALAFHARCVERGSNTAPPPSYSFVVVSVCVGAMIPQALCARFAVRTQEKLQNLYFQLSQFRESVSTSVTARSLFAWLWRLHVRVCHESCGCDDIPGLNVPSLSLGVVQKGLHQPFRIDRLQDDLVNMIRAGKVMYWHHVIKAWGFARF